MNVLSDVKETIPVKSIEFGIWSANDIKKLSVCEIFSSNHNGPNTVHDQRMGVTENRIKCATCFEDIHSCPSHFGHIDFKQPICHPLFYNEILDYLRCFCPICCKFRITTEQMSLMGLCYQNVNNISKQQIYLKNLLEQIQKIEFCQHCFRALPNFYINDNTFYMFFFGDKGKNVVFTDQEISDMFHQISQTDLNKMGIYNLSIHPENFIISVLPVLPPAARPSCKTDNGCKDDDLTYKYIEIIKMNNKLGQKDISENIKQSYINSLKGHCQTLMDNSKKLATQPTNGRAIKSLKCRLNGKTGLIRGNLSGKRVDFSARSVIGPDPSLCADEIALPQHIIETQSFPERAFEKNLDYLQYLVDNDKASSVERNNSRINLEIATQTGFKLMKNDIIFSKDAVKHLSNGSYNIQLILDQIFSFKSWMNQNYNIYDKAFIEQNMAFSQVNVIEIQLYSMKKNKNYVLQKGDIVFRNDICFLDLKSVNFRFQKGDKLIRQHTTIKIDAFDYIKNEPVFLQKGKQETLFCGDIIQRDNLIFGHMQPFSKRKFIVKIGDIVNRHLQNGDYIAFGRQPTLHKGSLLARKIRVIDESNSNNLVKTIRMNLAQTKSYNADFDGDEMNVYSSQSYEVAAEMKYIASTEANLKSGQNGRLLLSIHQDAMTGGFLMTQNLFDNCTSLPSKNVCFEKFTQNADLLSHLNSLHKKAKIFMSKSLFFDCCTTIKNIDIHKKIDYILKVLEWFNIPKDELYTGHTLFSMLLPDDFEYQNKISDSNWVIISRGLMISGSLCKGVLGDSQSSVIHNLEKQYSSLIAMDFVSNYQFIVNHWLMARGFSVGMDDCVLEKKIDIVESIDKSYLEASLIYQTESNESIREAKIANCLNSANNIGQILCKNAIHKQNAFRSMVECGSKGNYVNIAQIMGLLGQQNVEGGRVQKTYDLKRTLPHCLYIDIPKQPDNLKELAEIFRGRGFISSCFYNKLHPLEMFFHCSSGREAVAAEVSATGYLQRKLMKFMEDLKWTYSDTVTNAKDQIISWNYGSTNLEPSKLIHVNKNLTFIDIENVAQKLNMSYSWDKSH